MALVGVSARKKSSGRVLSARLLFLLLRVYVEQVGQCIST